MYLLKQFYHFLANVTQLFMDIEVNSHCFGVLFGILNTEVNKLMFSVAGSLEHISWLSMRLCPGLSAVECIHVQNLICGIATHIERLIVTWGLYPM